MSLAIHLALFVCVAVSIVGLSVCYADADDRRALAAFPKRLLHFLFGCTVLAAVILACEHWFGSVR